MKSKIYPILQSLLIIFLIITCIAKDSKIKELKANPTHDTVYIAIPDYINAVDTFVTEYHPVTQKGSPEQTVQVLVTRQSKAIIGYCVMEWWNGYKYETWPDTFNLYNTRVQIKMYEFPAMNQIRFKSVIKGNYLLQIKTYTH